MIRFFKLLRNAAQRKVRRKYLKSINGTGNLLTILQTRAKGVITISVED